MLGDSKSEDSSSFALVPSAFTFICVGCTFSKVTLYEVKVKGGSAWIVLIILQIIESITGAGFGNVIRCRAQIATGRPPTTHRRIQANTFTHFQTHIQTHFQTHRHKHSHPHTHTSYGSHAHILNSHTNRQTNEHTHTKPRKFRKCYIMNIFIYTYIYIQIGQKTMGHREYLSCSMSAQSRPDSRRAEKYRQT